MIADLRRDECYRKGTQDEKDTIAYMKTLGYNIRPSSLKENYDQDIDCWIDDVPVSIKSQHKGVRYQNIGFELANQLTLHQHCELTKALINELDWHKVERLLTSGSWESGWYFRGSAKVYLMYQGDYIRAYNKVDIQDYIEAKGFLKIRSLSYDTRSYLGGAYRHCNTICGYLNWDCVPHGKWTVR
jgi:hypothetical protein